jgi:hypothetical protein
MLFMSSMDCFSHNLKKPSQRVKTFTIRRNMKFTTTSIYALVLTLSLVVRNSAADLAIVATVPAFANAAEGACSPKEVTMIENKLNGVVATGGKKPGKRDLSTCSIVCKNWAPGYCYLRWPMCVGWRRNLRVASLEGDVDRHLDDLGLEEVFSVECARGIMEMEDTLKDLVKSVGSNKCKETLTAVKEFHCYKYA